jgi:uncharacterized protein YjbI with pentapeptide repeats
VLCETVLGETVLGEAVLDGAVLDEAVLGEAVLGGTVLGEARRCVARQCSTTTGTTRTIRLDCHLLGATILRHANSASRKFLHYATFAQQSERWDGTVTSNRRTGPLKEEVAVLWRP